MASRDLAGLLRWLEDTTGEDFSGRTFDSRLRIQKAIYFLRALRNPIAMKYTFGDYFYGPYSPSLAHDYYELMGIRAPLSKSRPIPAGPTAAPLLKEATGRGNDFLEACATIHAYLARNPPSTASEAKDYIRVTKPLLKGLADEAVAFLRKHKLLGAST